MSLSASARLGPYEVIDLLGAGGMGEVYRARDPRLGRDVAVKILSEEVARDPDRLACFEREARAIAALDHANILTVFDVGTHDGRWLLTSWKDGRLRRGPIGQGASSAVRVLSVPNVLWNDAAFDPRGRFVLGASFSGGTWLVPLDLSTGPGRAKPADPAREDSVGSVAFADERTLFAAAQAGVRRWDVETGRAELVLQLPGDAAYAMALARGPQVAIVQETRATTTPCDPVAVFELAPGSLTPLPQFGSCVGAAFDLDPTGQVVATAEGDGTLRVGRRDGSEPHVLLGHKGLVQMVTISPDLRWVASAGEDNTLRLWPMPDLSRPPLHTLPHVELLAKLKSLTNLRALRDPKAPSGWTIEVGPFPGWRNIPNW